MKNDEHSIVPSIPTGMSNIDLYDSVSKLNKLLKKNYSSPMTETDIELEKAFQLVVHNIRATSLSLYARLSNSTDK